MQAPRPRLALYGGAFNPPTLGHARTVERLLAAGFSRIIVMPCFGHSFGKSLAPAADRLLMAHECFRHLPEVRVSSFEIDLGMNGSTFELVEKLPLLAEYGTHDFYFAIGSDEANAFHRWRCHEELRARIPFVVVPREGELLDDGGAWSLRAPHIVIPRDEKCPPATASTQFRLALANGEVETATKLLAPRVWEHIHTRRLYPVHRNASVPISP